MILAANVCKTATEAASVPSTVPFVLRSFYFSSSAVPKLPVYIGRQRTTIDGQRPTGAHRNSSAELEATGLTFRRDRLNPGRGDIET
jgi:hypothetical protein